MSFNGTRSSAARGVDDDFNLDTVEALTPELHFEDKCESENFLLLDGQEVHIKGSLLGTLEIVISEDICGTACGSDDICVAPALIFSNPVDPDAQPEKYTYADLCVAGFTADAPTRFFVHATKGAHSLCDATCPTTGDLICPLGSNAYSIASHAADGQQILAHGTDNLQSFDGLDVQTAGMLDRIITTLGDNFVDAMSGDDYLEDHGGSSLLIGGSEKDTLVSRGGRDALWGGNTFMISYDDGASNTVQATIAAENAAADFDVGMFTIGEPDLYVIYPTTEKDVQVSEFDENDDDIRFGEKGMKNECTKVYGLES